MFWVGLAAQLQLRAPPPLHLLCFALSEVDEDDEDDEDDESVCPSASPRLLPSFALEPPQLQPCSSSSSSPLPSKTCSFQREPPEGCERVRVCEEASL